MKLDPSDIRRADPAARARLARFLGVEDTVESVIEALGLDDHICEYKEFGWAGMLICFRCGDLK